MYRRKRGNSRLTGMLRACLLAGAVAVMAAASGAIAAEEPMERVVTSTGYRTLLVESEYDVTDVSWCGNDALVYTRGRMGDGMFQSGEVVWVDVVTGERRTLLPDIFRTVNEVFFDEPVDGWVDVSGIFLVRPFACSPDGEWLFFQQAAYDGKISVNDKMPHQLRALHLTSGKEHVLSTTTVKSVRPAPDGKRLLIEYYSQYEGFRVTKAERASALPHWEMIDLPDGYEFLGWRPDAKSMIVVGRDDAGNFRAGLLEIEGTAQRFRPLKLPSEYEAALDEASKGPKLHSLGVRNGRLVGNISGISSSRNARLGAVFTCSIDGGDWQCQDTIPLEAARRYFLWPDDGTSVFFERYLSSAGRNGIVRQDLASGFQTTIVVDNHPFWYDNMRDELSPEGDKMLLGNNHLRVLFLQPPPE